MSISNLKLKAAISLALTIAVASVFTLSSFAASNTNERPPGESAGGRVGKILFDAPAGRLSGTGRLSIDGYEARSGATILSGSTIATGTDGNASIDLGQLGRIELRPNTAITLTFAPDSVQVLTSGAGSMAHSLSPGVACKVKVLSEHNRFAVARGQVKVESAEGVRTLNAGEEGRFDHASEATTDGDATFTSESGVGGSDDTPTSSPKGDSDSPGLYGVAVLFGVASGIALGIMIGSNDNEGTFLPKPSTVVP